jgi:hypothetical protein
MKITKMFFAVAGFLLLAANAFAQLSTPNESPWSLGFSDPKSSVSDGVTEPNSAEAQTTTPTTGTYVYNFTITLVSKIPAGTKIACIGQLQVATDSALVGGVGATATSMATISGNTATCTASISYAWNLGSPATDKLSRIVQITAPPQAVLGAAPYHGTQIHLGNIAMPANGATTTESVSITL